MKSSTFSILAIVSILGMYAVTSVLDAVAEEQVQAIHQCGNADFVALADGTIKCIIRKPLRGGRVKP